MSEAISGICLLQESPRMSLRSYGLRRSILKRGIYGVYQRVSEAHLRRYLAESISILKPRQGWRERWRTCGAPFGGQKESALRTAPLVAPRTNKQKAKRFLRWRKQKKTRL